MRDFIGSLLLAVVFAAAWAGTGEFPETVAVYPRLICGTGVLFAAIVMAQSMMQMKKGTAEKSSFQKAHLVPVVSTLGGALVYMLAIEQLGYLISTVLFVMVFSFLFDRTSKKWLYPLVAVCIAGAVYLLFSVALHIPLPEGELFM